MTKKGKLNIVMEYCDDGDLSTRISERTEKNELWSRYKPEYFKESQVLTWFAMIALGVKHCHDRSIIHGDLKS